MDEDNAAQQVLLSEGVEIEAANHDLRSEDDGYENSTQSIHSKMGTSGKEVSIINCNQVKKIYRYMYKKADCSFNKF